MKKTSLLVLISVAVSVCSFSQVKNKVKYGVFGGINISHIVIHIPNVGSDASDSKIGLNFGGLAEIPIDRLLSFQPELSYSALGWRQPGKVQVAAG